MRQFARLTVPRYTGLKAAAVLFAATGVAIVGYGGHGMTMVSALTAWSGLAITAVEITGQTETSEVDVLDSLAIGEFASLVTVDVDGARSRIEALPWVSQATIRKFYPDTLKIAVTERKAFAIWQVDGRASLIDDTGRVLATHVGERYQGLPRVVGEGADKRAGEYVAIIDGVPSLKPRIRAGVLISGRRWNVILDNGIELLLPEKDAADALVQVVALDDGSGILGREIEAVDLRLPNRLVFRLTDEGEKARKAMLDERAKAARTKGRA